MTNTELWEAVMIGIQKQYHSEPGYLWKRYQNYAVFRHRENRKWFAVIMN